MYCSAFVLLIKKAKGEHECTVSFFLFGSLMRNSRSVSLELNGPFDIARVSFRVVRRAFVFRFCLAGQKRARVRGKRSRGKNFVLGLRA